MVRTTDPLGRATVDAYDALARLTSTVDPASGTTAYAYDGLDNLLAVTDPAGQQTSYSVNSFGERVSETSASAGTTTYAYDAAGNMIRRTDGRGYRAEYDYDALNRPLAIRYYNADNVQLVTESVAFTYDDHCTPSSTYATGKVCAVSDASGTTSYTYNSAGKLVTKSQQLTGGPTLITGYGYNPAGQLTDVMTPGGHHVVYGYGNGRPVTVTVDGEPLIAGAVYEPFGPNGGWAWGDGDASDWRLFDHDYRPTTVQQQLTMNQNPPFANVALAWDSGNRITNISETGGTAASQSFGYDALDRLTAASVPAGAYSWTYDAVGNRLTQGGNGASTNYTYAVGQRLDSATGAEAAQFSYDGMGHTTVITGFGAGQFTYDGAGRMVSATVGGAPVMFRVNALGQRVLKVSTETVAYAYDEAGHLIGEYDSAGNALQETVWLDDLPVATLRTDGTYRVHSDHLGTPRTVTDANNAVRWRWDGDPFGGTAPNENPFGYGTFTYNLRYPGQVYDPETGLHQNYYREYSPAVGRYIQSDPIGLGGGMNTFTYASSAPTRFTDPLGKWSTAAHNYFILQTLGGIFGPGKLAWIMEGSESADAIYYQDGAHAYMHAMSSRELTAPAARALYCDFVRTNIQTFQAGRLSSDFDRRRAAYLALGFAMHAVMDSTSPAHKDFALWDGDARLHGPRVPFVHDHSIEDIDNAPRFLDVTRQKMLDLLNRGTDVACGC